MNINPRELAKDPNTPLDVFRKIAKTSKDEVVLAAVAENPNADAQLLIELFKNYPYQVLNNPAIELILLEHPDLFERLDRKNCSLFYHGKIPLIVLDWAAININSEICRSIARNILTPIFYSEKLADSQNSDVRRNVARNKNTAISCLKILATDKDSYVRRKVAKNENTPIDLLEILAKDEEDEYYYVRRNVARNKNTAISCLEILAENESYYVRAEVAQNKNTAYLLKQLAKDSKGDRNY